MTWLSTEQAAKLKGCSERTLRRNKERYKLRLVNGAGGERGTRYEFLYIPMDYTKLHTNQQSMVILPLKFSECFKDAVYMNRKRFSSPLLTVLTAS